MKWHAKLITHRSFNYDDLFHAGGQLLFDLFDPTCNIDIITSLKNAMQYSLILFNEYSQIMQDQKA